MRTPFAVLATFVIGLLLPLLTAAPAASAPDKPLAILVVGDQGAGILSQREKDMFRLLAAWRVKAKLTKTDLPIISYHFNKDDEREYCEKGLGIHRANLLFVGVVEHDKRVPQKVLFRLNNVVKTGEAADKTMAEVVERLGLDPGILNDTASPTPSDSPSAVPSSSPLTTSLPTKTRGVTLTRVLTVDHEGNTQSRFLTSDRGVYVTVFVHNDNPAADQHHTLAVRLIDPSGKPYGRTIGGTFNIVTGERVDTTDMLARSDPERHNGYLIKGNALAQRTGRFQVIVEIDGEVAGKTEFEIVPGN